VIPAWISSLMQIGRTASNNSVAPAEAMLCHTVIPLSTSTIHQISRNQSTVHEAQNTSLKSCFAFISG
jgi:hypothetical protein